MEFAGSPGGETNATGSRSTRPSNRICCPREGSRRSIIRAGKVGVTTQPTVRPLPDAAPDAASPGVAGPRVASPRAASIVRPASPGRLFTTRSIPDSRGCRNAMKSRAMLSSWEPVAEPSSTVSWRLDCGGDAWATTGSSATTGQADRPARIPRRLAVTIVAPAPLSRPQVLRYRAAAHAHPGTAGLVLR